MLMNEAPPARIDGVIFDMDGLMFDTERLAIEGWLAAGKEFGFDFSDDLVIETMGRNIPDTRAILEQGIGGKIPFTEMRVQRIAYADQFIRDHGVPIKRGLLELLDLLESQSIPRAVATSTERVKTEEWLHLAGLFDRFGALVCGDEVEHGKPEPDIFLAAARGIGIDPHRCAVLEDSEAGIRAAHAAGMIPLVVPDLRVPAGSVKALAHGVFESLEDVAVYFSAQFQDR